MKALLYTALSTACSAIEVGAHRVLLFCLFPIRKLGEWSWHRAALAELRARNNRRVDFHL